ncbi:MAG: hypothetical protein JWM02_3029 [Frankiales bacterium]|nr:hypothetical protein [Frankiales bacterium]
MTLTTGERELTAPMVDRYLKLSRRAAGIRGRRRAGDHSRLLVLAGGTAVAVGLLLVVLGYLGASHTIYVFEQIPYLISGGLLGGCLVVSGGFCYFAFWLTRVHAEVAASRANGERAAASLERVEQLLAALLEAQTIPPNKSRKAS